MHNRGFYIVWSIWLFAGISIGVSESLNPHQTVTGEEATVTLGTECAHALYERCLATQYATNPSAYRVALPDFGAPDSAVWPLDDAMMSNLDLTIKALVPFYVDSNQVAWTVASLWSSLGMAGTNFTRDSCVISNVFWDAADLTERYKVLWALRQTTSSVTRTYAASWGGSGEIVTNANAPLSNGCALAYDLAVANYDFITNGYLVDAVWTNDVSLQTTNLQQWARNKESVSTNYWYETNLWVTGGTNLVLVTNLNMATGGTITTNGNYTIHTFLGSGTFTVTNATLTNCEVLVVAGGGGGGEEYGGGGGAGGLVYAVEYLLATGVYSVVIGSGGAGGENGGDSIFGLIASIGGGAGGDGGCDGAEGGSGGGGGGYSGQAGLGLQSNVGGGLGYGHNGGVTLLWPNSSPVGAGGGGATGNGGDGYYWFTSGANGGEGMGFSLSGSNMFYAGGGGGGAIYYRGFGGSGGGGNGGAMSNECSAGAENSGGGGGGGYISGGSGGSGIVIVRYDNRVYAPGTNSPGALYTPTTPHAGFPAWAGPDGYVAQVEDDSHYHISCVLTNGTSSWVNASAEITPVSTNYTPETAMSAGILTAVYSNGLVHAGWTNVTYQVQLQKIGATNDFFTSTNRPHKAIYYANSVRPTLGTVTNAYNAYSHQSEHLFSSQSERYSELCDAVFLIDNT